MKTRQNWDLRNENLEKGKETRYYKMESCQPKGKKEDQNLRDQEFTFNLALNRSIQVLFIMPILRFPKLSNSKKKFAVRVLGWTKVFPCWS